MAEILTNNKYYYDIADTIRQMKNVNTTYKPRQMASALKDIYSNEVEGVPPLSFEANGNNLLNYRIDGASGGVGERTSNLFDGLIEVGTFTEAGLNTYSSNRLRSTNYIQVNPNTTYTIHLESNFSGIVISVSYYSIDDYITPRIGYENWVTSNQLTFTSPNNCQYIRLIMRYSDNRTISSTDVYNVQIVEGTEIGNYEPYGYKVPVVVSGKNLFDETQVPDKSASTEASNYQIFKQNGKLIVNGMTVSNQVDTEISKTNGVNNQALDFINNNAGNYIFTSSVPGRIMIRYKQNGSDVVRYTFNEYNSTNKIADRIVFRLQQNYQYDNEPMNIMFKLNQIQSTNYEPYHEPTTTTIYLDEPIEENESISLSDTNVNIPTIDGTNVISIDTTVQPSNVYIQAPKDTPKMIEARERLEVI